MYEKGQQQGVFRAVVFVRKIQLGCAAYIHRYFRIDVCKEEKLYIINQIRLLLECRNVGNRRERFYECWTTLIPQNLCT
jgi:hypothetical protein